MPVYHSPQHDESQACAAFADISAPGSVMLAMSVTEALVASAMGSEHSLVRQFVFGCKPDPRPVLPHLPGTDACCGCPSRLAIGRYPQALDRCHSAAFCSCHSGNHGTPSARLRMSTLLQLTADVRLGAVACWRGVADGGGVDAPRHHEGMGSPRRAGDRCSHPHAGGQQDAVHRCHDRNKLTERALEL